jgi:hypothetical protein
VSGGASCALWNRGPETESERHDVPAAARAIGQQLIILDVGSEQDIETAFATLAQRKAGAVFVGASPFLNLVPGPHRRASGSLCAAGGL